MSFTLPRQFQKSRSILQDNPKNNPKDLDPSYKMDLDCGSVLEGKQTLSYNRRNMVRIEALVAPWDKHWSANPGVLGSSPA